MDQSTSNCNAHIFQFKHEPDLIEILQKKLVASSCDDLLSTNQRRAIPVPAPRTRRPAIEAAAEQVRQKHLELIAVRKRQTHSKSISAPSSPTTPRRLFSGTEQQVIATKHGLQTKLNLTVARNKLLVRLLKRL